MHLVLYFVLICVHVILHFFCWITDHDCLTDVTIPLLVEVVEVE